MQAAAPTLWTCGHSTRPWEEFLAMLAGAGITQLVDVRRFAGSRRNPQFGPEIMRTALAASGIAYLPLPPLGGRRRANPDSPNDAWRVEAFQAYADHLASAEYQDGRAELMALARQAPTSVMCAEAVWWRCHRRLIADDFVARGWEVRHLLGPGRASAHRRNPDAVMIDDVLRYPAPAHGPA